MRMRRARRMRGADLPGAGRVARRAAVAVALAGLLLTACDGGGGAKSDGKQATKSPASVITVKPGSGGTAASPGDKVTVRSSGGRLLDIRVSAPDTDEFGGSLSADGHTWTSSALLAPATKYTVVARAKGTDGKTVTRRTTIATARARGTFVGEYSPEKGSTVGVGMPVSVVFNKPVRDKAAVERRLAVTTSPHVDGAWSWVKDHSGRDRVDYRPRKFWTSGTEVTLRMALSGVDAGGGVYGTQQRVVRFHVGHAVVSTVDADRKTMTVRQDGKVLRTLPVSSGKPGYETWNGTMVVLEKVPSIRMNSRTVGIFGPEAYNLGSVKWAVRLTPSGTFVHAAPWNAGKFGRVNGSHGCVGMSTSDARWFFGHVHLGDPVTVVHSKDTVAEGNGYGDWNVDWATWRAGSALS